MLWGSFAACAAKHVSPFGAFEKLVALFKSWSLDSLESEKVPY